jgi:hypothetical protein
VVAREEVVIKTKIVECAGMSKCQNKMKTKSEIMMLLLHHLKRKPFNLLSLLDEKSFVWIFLKIFLLGTIRIKVVRIRGRIPTFQ